MLHMCSHGMQESPWESNVHVACEVSHFFLCAKEPHDPKVGGGGNVRTLIECHADLQSLAAVTRRDSQLLLVAAGVSRGARQSYPTGLTRFWLLS